MHFPSKKSFVRASLLLIFAVPTLAYADDQKDQVPKNSTSVETVSADDSARYLSLADAKLAFGSEFSIENSGKTYDLFGGTSKDCLTSFDIKNSGETGQFTIKYLGGKPKCLDFSKAMKGVSEGDQISLAATPDGQMTPTGTFDKVVLFAPRTFTSKESSEELLLSDGKSLAHESAADAKKRVDQEKVDKLADRKDLDVKFISKCVHGFSELEVRQSAIDDLQKTVKEIADKDSELDAKYFDQANAETRAKIFRGCEIQIMNGAVADLNPMFLGDEDSDAPVKATKKKSKGFSASDCSSKLEKIALKDPKYVKKIEDLYMAFIKKQMANQPAGLDKAYEAAEGMMEKLRAFADDHSVDGAEDAATPAKIDALDKAMHLQFLALAAKGDDPEFFNTVKSDIFDYMAGDEKLADCNNGAGVPSAKELRMPTKGCAASLELSNALFAQTNVEGKTQFDLANKKAMADLAADCQTATPKNPMACKAMDDAAKSAASLAANGSLNTAANGYGQATTGTTNGTPSVNPATTLPSANGTSGLMNSGYTAMQAPAPVAATVNTAPGIRQVFR